MNQTVRRSGPARTQSAKIKQHRMIIVASARFVGKCLLRTDPAVLAALVMILGSGAVR